MPISGHGTISCGLCSSNISAQRRQQWAAGAGLLTLCRRSAMSVDQIIILARKHLGSNSSARLCMADAVKLYDEGRLDDAKQRALRSLQHSIGILHKDYQRAAK